MNMFGRCASAFRRAPKAPPAEVEPPGGAAFWTGGEEFSGALARGADEWRGSGLPEGPTPTRSATE